MFRKNLVVVSLILFMLIIFPSTALAATRGAIVKIGQDIIVNQNEILDAIVSIGGEVEVNGTVQDAVVAIGSNVKINGTVNDAVVVIGGKALVNNEIKGDLVVIGNKATLSPQTIIHGDLVLVGVDLEHENGAQIRGDLTEISIDQFFLNFPTNFALFGIPLATIIFGLIIIGSTLFSLLVLLAGLIFPEKLKRSQVFLLNSPGKTLLIGFVLMLFFLPISFVLFITIIGIPLLLLFWLIFGIMVIWGLAVLASLAGQKVTDLFNYKGNSLTLQLIIGILLFLLISQVPIIGWLIIFILKIFALGTSVISHLGFRKN